MKTTNQRTKQTKGFTLIEMIGVLAVIAILAALLIPKVFQAITEAKLNTVPVGASTCKTGTIDHYAKYGGLNVSPYGTNYAIPQVNYDQVLLAEGFIDKPFAPRVGVNPDVVLAAITASTVGVIVDATEGTTYCLSGAAGTLNETAGSHVVYALIEDVPIADAQAISARIDGNDMSSTEAAPGTQDLEGRVKYATSTGIVDVYIYLTHR